MRLKLLLLLLFATCMVYAQEPYRNLIFSEVNMTEQHFSYLELCNMGEKSIDLSEFELGMLTPWNPYWTLSNFRSSQPEKQRMRLPKKMLDPGKTFLIATWWNLADTLSATDPERWLGNRRTSAIMKQKADLLLSPDESGHWSLANFSCKT